MQVMFGPVLKQEYGQTYDVKLAMAECDLHALVKSSSDTMQDHINKFKRLIADVNFNRPAEIPPMRKAEIDFISSVPLKGKKATEVYAG